MSLNERILELYYVWLQVTSAVKVNMTWKTKTNSFYYLAGTLKPIIYKNIKRKQNHLDRKNKIRKL